MFKLLPLILSLVVFSAAYPEGQPVVPEAKLASMTNKSTKTAQEQQLPSTQAQPPSTNSISSEEQSNESDDSADKEEAPTPLTPASITHAASFTYTDAQPPAPATASHSSLLLSSVLKSASNIQHHILPAQIIPLPITISTRPGLRTIIAPETFTIQEPTIAKVGEVVQHIPTAVSHHSQTIVHKHARVVTPIVAPVVRTITSQVVRAYHTPLIYAPQTHVE